MRRKRGNKMQCIESLGQHLIKSQKCRRIISLQERIDKREAIFIVQHIQVAKNILIFDISTAERNSLVKDSQCITHRTIRLMSNYMQRLIINSNPLIYSHHSQILHNVLDSDSIEIVCLTTRKDSRKDLMLLCRCKNKDCMRRWFLKCLKEGVESSLREHMYLIDDIHAISSDLRRYAHLLHQCLDILNTII